MAYIDGYNSTRDLIKKKGVDTLGNHYSGKLVGIPIGMDTVWIGGLGRLGLC